MKAGRARTAGCGRAGGRRTCVMKRSAMKLRMMSAMACALAMISMHAVPTATETATCDHAKAMQSIRLCHEGGGARTASRLASGSSTRTHLYRPTQSGAQATRPW